MSETNDREQNVQNDFFNEARKARTRVAISLTSGKRLVGRIKSFDRFAVVLDAGGGVEEMIFKHAIATVSVAMPRPHQASISGGGRNARPAPRSAGEGVGVGATAGAATPTPDRPPQD